MAAITLYPPIVDTYMPAFTIDSGTGIESSECRIYFAISNYNALGDKNNNGAFDDNEIQSIWISVTNQFTNSSIVDIEQFKSGLISLPWTEISEDLSRTGDDRYYIKISANYLKEKKWSQGQVYKVQLRFCNKAIEENTMSWVTENSMHFSEWSTVCLLQGILKPELYLNNFSTAQSQEVIFNIADNHIVGKVVFDSADGDFLNSYNIQLFKQSDINEPVYDSGDIYTNSFTPNEINHFIKYGLEDGVRYLLKIKYLSDKLYEETVDYKFLVLDTAGGEMDVSISAEAQNELGRIKVTVTSELEKIFGSITIRRASVKDNFMIWEDVKTLQCDGLNPLDLTWYDYAIESGVWYKYCVQKRNIHGHRGVATMVQQPVMSLFDDMFLVGENQQQLKIKFNPQISSYSHTVLESSTQTIGSKYPFVKRNGNVNYRQFSIAGLISHFMDEEELFVRQDDLHYGEMELYQTYNEEHKITKYNDFTLEKTFREKVQNFLNDGKIKLFKSNAEGTMLVRLMNLSFTPEQALGRMLYSFTATAIEIDDCSLDNINKYNIQKLGSYQDVFSQNLEKSTQFYLKDNFKYRDQIKEEGEKTSVFSLKDVLELQESLNASKEKIISVKGITKANITFKSKPYLVRIESNGSLTRITKNTKTTSEDNIVLGYILKVGENYVLVGTHGGYVFDGDMVNDIYFIDAKDDKDDVFIQCSYIIAEEENLNNMPTLLSYYQITGQDFNLYYPTDNVINDYIIQKYDSKNNSNYTLLYSLDDLIIEAEPNTVFYLQDSSNENYQRFMLGDTAFLDLGETDYFYTGMFFVGTHLIEKEKDKQTNLYKNKLTQELEYVDRRLEAAPGDEGRFYQDIAEVEETKKSQGTEVQMNEVYRVSSIADLFLSNIPIYESFSNNYLFELYEWTQPKNGHYDVIFYQNNWYLFTENNDVLHPVAARVNYCGEIEKGEFFK